MAQKRFTDNPALSKYDRFAIPCTDLHDSVDKKIGLDAFKNIANAAKITELGVASIGGVRVATLNDIVAGARGIGQIPGRNLVQVLGASSVRDACDKLRARGSNYDGLMYGDYIDIPALTVEGIGPLEAGYQNLRYEIGAFNQYYNSNGIVFVNKNISFKHSMNPLDAQGQNTNKDGYNGCELKKILNGAFARALEAAIGPLKTAERLVDTHGSWTWASEKCWLPSEVEIYGYQAWGRGGYYGGTSAQYPIYALDPRRRIKNYNGSRYWYWEGTSSSSSSTNFCLANSSGGAGYYGASNDSGVSPAFYL